MLRDVTIERQNQVRSTDIIYICLARGFIYLVAILDWFSRYVLAWEVSVTLDTSFCLQALDRALGKAKPDIFNSDQGVQFISTQYTQRLQAASVRIRWDGRGRALDNIFVERLWRSAKYEEVYIKEYQSVADAVSNLRAISPFTITSDSTNRWRITHQPTCIWADNTDFLEQLSFVLFLPQNCLDKILLANSSNMWETDGMRSPQEQKKKRSQQRSSPCA